MLLVFVICGLVFAILQMVLAGLSLYYSIVVPISNCGCTGNGQYCSVWMGHDACIDGGSLVGKWPCEFTY